jgi:lysophospholipase L1-like esterase
MAAWIVLTLLGGQSAPSTTTIVALGDSTTAGTPGFLSPIEAPPDGRGDVRSQYAYWLMQARPGWKVLNRGVNGERSDEIRTRFDRDVTAAKPDVVVILAGVNDVYQGRTAEDVERNLQWMYDRARAAGIAVVAASVIPYDTASADQNARMHAVNDWIRRIAARDSNIVFCDTRRAVASAESIDRLGSSPDGLHPDVEGYRRMAEAIEGAVAESLKRSQHESG